MEDGDFEQALRGARRRDEASFEVLFRQFQPLLLRFLRAKVPRGAAEDYAADVWVSVAQGLDRFDGDLRGFRAWLFTMARNRAIDHHRRAGSRRTDPVADVPDDVVEGADATVIGALSAQEAVDLMRRHLTTDQFDVVALRVIGDLDAASVATILGRSENWVRVTQHRAVLRLSERLGGARPGESMGRTV